MDRETKRMLILENSLKHKKLKPFLPSVVSALRLITFPFLIFSINNGQVFFGDFLFVFAICSDFADGYLARRMSVSSKFGASLDVAVDFLFIGGMFLFFVIEGVYPAWVFLLTVFMFAQFKVTRFLSKIAYRPFRQILRQPALRRDWINVDFFRKACSNRNNCFSGGSHLNFPGKPNTVSRQENADSNLKRRESLPDSPPNETV